MLCSKRLYIRRGPGKLSETTIVGIRGVKARKSTEYIQSVLTGPVDQLKCATLFRMPRAQIAR